MRANPRYDMSELSDLLPFLYESDKNYNPIYFQAHFKATKIEFNKAHPLQVQLKQDYVFGWISEQMHRQYGYVRLREE